jgi:hypothetical protein
MALGALGAAPVARCEEGREARTGSGSLFAPLTADSREPHFFASVLGTHVDSLGDSVTIGSVGFGDDFGIFSVDQGRGGLRVGLQAGVMAQFLLEPSRSYPLLNADYVVGLPVSWRRDRVSARVRLYHQSSHLGDEYLLQNPTVARVNVSFEELEAIGALDLAGGRGRVYVGGGVLVHRGWDTERGKLLAGLEWRGRNRSRSVASRPLATRLVAGVEVKLLQAFEWRADVRAVAGLELASGPRGRALALLAEYYHGSFPFGQFFEERTDHLGIGLHIGL